MALGCTLDEFRRRKTAQTAPPESVGPPTTAELREHAAELGLELAPTRLDTVRAEARDQMFALLVFSDNGQPDG